MCPHSEAALVLYTYALAKGHAGYEKVFTTYFYRYFLPILSLPPFYQFFIINHGLHLRLIQTLRLHLSRSTRLRETLTADHCFRIEYFQHTHP